MSKTKQKNSCTITAKQKSTPVEKLASMTTLKKPFREKQSANNTRYLRMNVTVSEVALVGQ